MLEKEASKLKTTETLKIGELARRTGISVRTLHYYDAINLLSPSQRSSSGYRLYTPHDVTRLGQIKSLRYLGFSLEEIRHCLSEKEFQPLQTMQLHITRLKEQIAAQQRLCKRLETTAQLWRESANQSLDDLLKTLEEMSRMEKYYTPQQLQELEERKHLVGEKRLREVETEWPQLMEKVRIEMGKGTDPADEAVQSLARRWMALVNEFTGGNTEIWQSLSTMYEQEPVVGGLDMKKMRPLFEYIGKAIALQQA